MFSTIWAFSIGLPVAFVASLLLLIFKPFANRLLGRDRGRLYAIDSEVNKGKYTGVGIYFMLAFGITVATFCTSGYYERIILGILGASSFFGFMDDRSISPWKEWVKGVIDIGLAVAAAFLIPFAYTSDVVSFTGSYIHIPFLFFVPLASLLLIVSVNATNATDGVDGLSGTLTIITTVTLIVIAALRGTLNSVNLLFGLVMIAVLIPYLFFNFYPSKVLMGDAGSRGIGFFIALYAMILKIPFTYLIIGLPFLLDGGLSILKITIGRLTHKKVIILKNTLTPIHDHLKKQKKFSVPKTYFVICGFAVVIDIVFIAANIFLKLMGIL